MDLFCKCFRSIYALSSFRFSHSDFPYLRAHDKGMVERFQRPIIFQIVKQFVVWVFMAPGSATANSSIAVYAVQIQCWNR